MSEVLQTSPQQSLIVPAKTEKTREVLADTEQEGEGDLYALPAKPSFDNPIAAIHHVADNYCCMKFETKDGAIGAHPASKHSFVRLAINPPETAIALIKVWISPDRIYGIQLIGKDGTVLVAAGACKSEKLQEIPLEDGERLIGIRSRQLKNEYEYGTRHCKMVFVIGKME